MASRLNSNSSLPRSTRNLLSTVPNPAIQAERLWKKLGDKWVLKDVTISIPRSSVTVILGPNGAGKTTLLRVLSGLYKPDKGFVKILGSKPEHARSKGLLFMLPDEVGLYPRLTGREHIRFFTSLYGAEPEAALSYAKELGLDAVLDKQLYTYSRGMRRKLQLAIALGLPAKILLLDEPLTGLDVKSVNIASRLVKILAEQGKTIVLTTHEVWLAEKLADYIIVLDEGVVVSQGWLKELLAEERVANLEEYLVKKVYGGKASGT